MFFKDYFNSIAGILALKFKSVHTGKNKSDKGELCEVFTKDLLKELFNDQFKIFRGGEIININNSKSKQIDIILVAKNTVKFSMKRGYFR